MYPVNYEADFNPAPNRWTTFFRLILAIPWLIVGLFWGLLFIFTHFFAWVSLIILGRYPEWLYQFNAGVLRYGVRVTAWLYLQTDEWPPFGLSDDPSYPIRVNVAPRAERQSRLKALFRFVLVLPMIVVAYAVSYFYPWVAVVAWLAIVFRGYMPEGIHTTMTFVNSFHTRLFGYFAFLTDDYPPIGAEKAGERTDAAPSISRPSPPPAPQAG